MKFRLINLLLFGSVLGGIGAASAGPAANPVVLQMESAMEQDYTDDKGKPAKRLVPVTRVIPGDEVVYTIRFTNDGAQPATNVVISNPIPPQLTYKAGSALGAGTVIEFSVDDGRTWGPASDLRVRDANGQDRPATPADYTHIRWRMANAVPPGQTGFVRYRAILK